MHRAASRCPRCRYDLTGLLTPRCPECGYKFSDGEWADKSLIVSMPAWERLGYVNAVIALAATILAVTFRPLRFLRGLRRGEGLIRAGVFILLAMPIAWTVHIGLAFAAVKLGGLAQDRFSHFGCWELDLWADKPMYRYATFIRSAIEIGTFMLAGLLVWLPALVVLDLAYWRERLPFRLATKFLLYTSVWWLWAGAFATGVGGQIIYQLGPKSPHLPGDSAWMWGWKGAWPDRGWWPWPCWLASVVATAQLGFALRFVTAKWSPIPLGARRRLGLILVGGWFIALYLLLFDRYVHLRFWLLFGPQKLNFLYRWLQGP